MHTFPLRLAIAASLLLPASLPAQAVHAYQSSPDLSMALAAQPDLRFRAGSAVPGPTITVDDAERFQTMDGFGASMTDGAAWLLSTQLSAAAREQVMVRLFDPRRGIGLSFLRQPIGSSDLSRSHTSFDDLPPGEQDPELRHFSAAHDDAFTFPALREALRLNPALTVMASPWSPPAWMKRGSHPEPGRVAAPGTPAETMNGGRLRSEDEAVYAAYLVRSVKAFQTAGIPLSYLTVQNEPLHDASDFPSTFLPAAQEKELIGRYLGPELRRAGLQTGVLAYDHNWDHLEYPEEVLADPAASPFIAGSALHCYGGEAAAQSMLHDRYPSKGIWMTECSGGTWQRESALTATAHLLLDVTRNWGKSVVLWGLVLDTDHNPHAGGCGTCRGLVTVDREQNPPAVTYTGDYYALGHASRFVFPGATRIGVRVAAERAVPSAVPGAVAVRSAASAPVDAAARRDALESVAFQNTDGSLALLVLNNEPAVASFTVRWHGRSFPGLLAAGSLATYTWRPAQSGEAP